MLRALARTRLDMTATQCWPRPESEVEHKRAGHQRNWDARALGREEAARLRTPFAGVESTARWWQGLGSELPEHQCRPHRGRVRGSGKIRVLSFAGAGSPVSSTRPCTRPPLLTREV